ncbi:MAG: hypothetical protein KKA64_00915 [Nanoarchaeota archaeon]|nr:hypothetical protein [Nanoarchaeota archaeon]
MKTKTQEIEQKLNQEKNRLGLVNGTLKINEYDETEHNVSASIDPKNWNIKIDLRTGFNPIHDKRQSAYARKKKISDGLEVLVSDIASHEIAHWQLPYGSEKGCPYDTYNHDKILEAVKSALPSDKQGNAGYMANAFEDLMINPRCKEYKGDSPGQTLFWDNEMSLAREKEKRVSPVYEAFVKLNMHLFGDNLDKALLKRHYSNDKRIEQAVRKTISELNLPENIHLTQEGTSMLFNKPDWSRMAGIFAKNMADLLESSPPSERLSAYSQEGQGQGQEKKQTGNGIEQKLGTRDGKEKIAYGRYSNRERQSTNITSYEQLDALYRRLARAIPVNVEAMTREQSLNISPLTFRAFDKEKDDIAKIKTSKLILTDQGLEFGYAKEPLTVQSRSKIQRKSFPDFKLVVLDNSGSMAQGINGNKGNTQFIPWGDNSKYHYALLGFYGIENFLQMQGISQYINHGLSLFSNQTRYKESDYQGIDAVRKLALAPEFGNTNLDAKTLTRALSGRESFALSISDGEIGNWDSEKADFKNLAEKSYFAHIQIGRKTQFSRDLESWNMPVFYVNKGEDLTKLMVNTALSTYKKFTRE